MSNLQPISEVRLRRVGSRSAYVLGLLVAFVITIAMFVMLSLMYLFLDTLGVITPVNQMLRDLMNVHVQFITVVWVGVGLAVWNMIFIPILFVVPAWIYNLCADIMGGLKMGVFFDEGPTNGRHSLTR